jgi:hypothetical protein
MMQELFIENRRLDLSKDISTLITFAVDDVKDFSSRNTSFSKTIVLPGTANNNSLFGNIFDVRISNPYDSLQDNVLTNFNASVAADCIIFQDHIQIFKGTLRLLEVVIIDGVPEYEVSVFGELGGLVLSLGAKKLEDLDFSAYNHSWTHGNITASWDATPGTGYFYPLIDYGGVSADKISYDIRAFRPAFYVREFLDKMITTANYRWQSALFDSTRFKKLIIPNNKKTLQTITTVIGSGTAGGVTVISNALGGERDFETPSASGTDFTYSAGVWTYTGTDPKTFTLRVSAIGGIPPYSGGIVMSNGNMYIGVKKNSVAVYYDTPALTVANGGSFDVDFDYDITLNNGDTFSIFATRNGTGTFSLSLGGFDLQILSPVPVVADLTPGSTVVMNDIIPKNVLQTDFISSIVKLFNLYIFEDRNESRKLYIEPYTDFYNLNVSGVVDWTYKVDRSKAIRLKPMSELNYRYYDFKFKQDVDWYNELYRSRYNDTYGSYLYDSAFQFANDKKEISLIFAPTPLVGYVGTDKVVSALYKKNAGVEEKTDTVIRILQSKKITGVTSWSIKNGATVLTTITNYGYGGHYDDPDSPSNDIHFGVPAELFFTLVTGAVNVTQFNLYWSTYMAEITDKDSKLMMATAKLLPKDIYDLDFRKLVFVDGSYFALNKIEDYNASEPDTCKIELLKRINLLY